MTIQEDVGSEQDEKDGYHIETECYEKCEGAQKHVENVHHLKQKKQRAIPSAVSLHKMAATVRSGLV